ncbi:MAG: site-specific integrase [Candidatus Thiodiazotropha sp. (ex. Lucinisca nassula)]|nr:site-specific integrase [Candidatus Thiodiazotropha sp. (ex. Lucinisca nassula)]
MELFDGEIKIFKTNAGGDTWQFRTWISGEKKYVRKSLKTKKISEAKERAKQLYLELQGKILSGETVFDKKYAELVEEYLASELKSVEFGEKSHGRYVTIRSQMKHFLNFVGPHSTTHSVSSESFRGYLNYRKTVSATVRQSTVLNEAATIKHFYKWAIKSKKISDELYPNFGKMKNAKKVEKINRDAIDKKDYLKITKFIEHWHRSVDDDIEIANRKFIREAILVLSNTGIRFGELRKLRWKDVTVIENVDADDGNNYIAVELEIREGKTGPRHVVGRRGDVFNRIKLLSNHKKDDDYVFVDNQSGKQLKRGVYYKLWKEIMDELGFDEKGYVYYSLRHSFATNQLENGKIDVYTLSRLMGTSVKNIEDHYGHIDLSNKTAAINAGAFIATIE